MDKTVAAAAFFGSGGRGKFQFGRIDSRVAVMPPFLLIPGKAAVPVSYTHLDVYKRQGVTVDRKTGHVCHDGMGIDIVDLPGIYSLSPYTQEEIIAREYVLSDELDGILNIVDAANIERNLYLTLQDVYKRQPF